LRASHISFLPAHNEIYDGAVISGVPKGVVDVVASFRIENFVVGAPHDQFSPRSFGNVERIPQ
jgi:hypothetical protein